MTLNDILSGERVDVARGKRVQTKDDALRALSAMLASGGLGPSADEYLQVFCEREALQSTGIGDGVAIPHGALEALGGQIAAVLICPDGVPFEAIDDRPVRILFAVAGPKRATGEHLKTLARVSRLLRDAGFREKLLASAAAAEAFDLIRSAEEGRAA